MRARSAVPAVLAAAAWPFVEPLFPVLRRTTLPLLAPDARPLSVLHLSDLHLLPRHRRRAAWVSDLARLRPDLVVSTGDHLSSYDALDLLTGIARSFPVPGVFVPGNNDYYRPQVPVPHRYITGNQQVERRPMDLPWPKVSAALACEGWTELTHRRIVLELAGTPVTLTGTDDATLRRDRYSLVAGPVEGLGIGVIHTPARRLLDGLVGDGHALVLAGHTHGGQLRLPGVGALVTNCDLERSRARGLSRHGAAWLNVSAGLGSSPWLPIRLCCRPEATLVTLVPVVR